MGRFISADGILGANKDMTSYNLYAYVSNNPVMYSDPSGEIINLAVKFIKYVNKESNKIVEKYKKALPDYSEELNNTLIKNAAQAHVMKNTLNEGNLITYFYNEVNKNGPWDYKIVDNWKKDIDVPFLGNSGYFVWDGEITTAEQFGNIHYGFIGASLGFDDTILFIGGGYANTGISLKILFKPYYGDSSEDHYSIQKGINLYHNWK